MLLFKVGRLGTQPQNRLWECISLACLDEVVRTLPEGLNTRIGRQYQIFLPYLEKEFFDRLEEWLRKRMVVIISHKPSTLSWADKVYLLKD